MQKYSKQTVEKCRNLYLNNNLTFREISQVLDGKPSASTIERWANESGWFNSKYAKSFKLSENFLPDKIADKIIEKITLALELDCGEFNPKTAELVVKLHKTLNEIRGPEFQLPCILHGIKKFLKFAEQKHSDVITDQFKKILIEFLSKLKSGE